MKIAALRTALDFVKAILFAILLALGGQVEFPVSATDVILTDFFLFSGALMFTRRVWWFSVVLFMLAGAVGLPVFADGNGGIEHFGGATGGYLFGYMLGGGFCNYLAALTKFWYIKLAAVLLGFYILFVAGILGLMLSLNMNVIQATLQGFIPFALAMHLKALAALATYYLVLWFNQMRKR